MAALFGAGLSTDSEVQKLLILMDCSARLSLGFAEDAAKNILKIE